MPAAVATERKAILARFSPEIHKRIVRLAEENKRSYGGQVAYMVEKQLAAEEGDK